jgi:hypothetical protein
MVKILWYCLQWILSLCFKKNKETNYYKISFWTCSMCDTLDASMNVSLHGIELEQNVVKNYPKDSLLEWLEEVPSFSLHFMIFVWKSQKACQLIVVWNLTFYPKDSLLEWLEEVPSFALLCVKLDILSKLGTHTKRKKKRT